MVTQFYFYFKTLCLLIQKHVEHYGEAIGALVSSLSDKPDLLRRIVEYVFGFLVKNR